MALMGLKFPEGGRELPFAAGREVLRREVLRREGRFGTRAGGSAAHRAHAHVYTPESFSGKVNKKQSKKA